MTIDVSSEFKGKLHSQSLEVVRTFTIGSSDYSEHVLKWPKFRAAWDEVRPAQISMNLANEDQDFNFFRDDKTHLRDGCAIDVGVVEADDLLTEDGEQLLTEAGQPLIAVTYNEEIKLFTGEIVKVRYMDGTVSVTAQDKFKKLGDRVIGNSEDPVSYTSSDYLPSDIAWFICTSHAGFSAIESTSNPDIDWTAFQEWAAIFSGDNVLMRAEFDGNNCNSVLKKIARMTRSSIYISDNKISFKRFTLADSVYTGVDEDSAFSVGVEIDDSRFVNRQLVFGGYSVESDYWTISTLTEDAASVNSFGARENVIKDKNVWYTDSSSCINLGERITITENVPFDQVSAKVGLLALPIELGDVVTLNDTLIDIADTYRVMEREFDLEKLKFKLGLNKTQLRGAFTLDVSTLDGPDVLI